MASDISHVEYLFELLSQQNDSTYIGEAISQLQHSLQAAHLAARAGESEEVAIAALLHDVGQILPMEEKTCSRELARDLLDESGKSVGRAGHEKIGEVWLRAHGWPEFVCQLVGAHVVAKR